MTGKSLAFGWSWFISSVNLFFNLDEGSNAIPSQMLIVQGVACAFLTQHPVSSFHSSIQSILAYIWDLGLQGRTTCLVFCCCNYLVHQIVVYLVLTSLYERTEHKACRVSLM